MNRTGLLGSVAVVALVAAGATAWWWLSSPRRVSSDLLEGLLAEVIAGATDGLYSIELGELTIGEMGDEIRIDTVRVAPDTDAVAAARAAGKLPALRFALEVESITIRGVAMGPLLSGQGLHARQIEVMEPTILATAERESAAPRSPVDEGDDTAEPAGAQGRREELTRRVDAMLEGIPELRVGTVVIRGGSGELQWWSAPGAVQPARVDRIGTVDITFSDLDIHEDAGIAGFRSLYSHDVSLRASDFDLGGPDTGPEWRLGELAISTGGGMLQVEDVILDPRVAVPDYLGRSHVAEADRTALWVGSARGSGFDFQRFLEALDLRMETLEIGAFRLEILNDRHKPRRGGGNDDPERMPHDMVRDLGVPLEIGEIRFDEGLVSYSERPAEVPTPGVITFENIEGTIAGVSNDPTRMTTASPAVADIRALMYGVAPLTLRVELPLLAPAPTMALEGEIASFDPRVLNRVLTRLTGSEIRGGEILGVAFDVDYAPRRATGTFRAEYRGLSVTPVDAATGGRDLLDVVAGFIASNFIIRSDNVSRPGDPARAAPIDYTIDPYDGFFKILWQPLRDGATALVLD